MIGSFGDLVFVVSEEKIRTFQNFQRNTSVRWVEHDIYMKQPKSQYIGPSNDTITFDMQFDISFGMKPRNEMSKLIVMCRDGIAHRLLIGGVPMGTNKWFIESVNQTWKRIDEKGNVLYGEASVTLKEYN